MDEGGARSGASPLRKLCWGNLEGRLLYWGPWRICRKDSGDGHLSTGLRWTIWKGALLPGLCDRNEEGL